MRNKLGFLFTFTCLLTLSCAKATIPPPFVPVIPIAPIIPDKVVAVDTSFYAKGADIGWLSQMETEGKKFYDSNGIAKDAIELLKSKGINSIRLRVWVNPTNNYCSISDVIQQAKRAQNVGMKIMIDFHYSDWWADPGKQNKPAAWKGLAFADLTNTVYTYTKDAMTQLKNNGVVPTWVQIGNETNDGMLWEEGRASKNMSNFAALISAGSKAVKEVSSVSKVLVHISNGYDNGMFRWIFDGLKNNNVSYDVIAMSLYPSSDNWSTLNNQCLTNMNDMIVRYGKEIMISEVGMDFSKAAECKSFLTDLIKKNKSLPDQKGLGVFYWEPQSYNNWQGYSLGAFTNEGKPSIAMDAFLN